MRKRFEAVTEREKSYKGELNAKVNGEGIPESRSGYLWTPGLKIEIHQQQIGDRFWFVRRHSYRKAIRRDMGEKKKRRSWGQAKNDCICFWGQLHKGLPHLPLRCEDRILSKHMRALQQKMRKIISRSVSALFLLMMVYFSLSI